MDVALQQYSQNYRYVLGTVMILTTGSATLLYMKIWKSFVTGRLSTFSLPFYHLCTHLGVAEMIFLSVILFYGIPYTIAGKHLYPEWLELFLGGCNNFSFSCIIAFVTYISAERLYTLRDNQIMDREGLSGTQKTIVGVCWLFGVVSIVLNSTSGCFNVMDPIFMRFTLSCKVPCCPSLIPGNWGGWIAHKLLLIKFSMTIVTLVLNTGVAIKLLRFQMNKGMVADQQLRKRRIRDARISLQLILVSSVLVFEVGLFVSFIFIGVNAKKYHTGILITILAIINSASTPVIFATFNPLVQKNVLKLGGPSTKRSSVHPSGY